MLREELNSAVFVALVSALQTFLETKRNSLKKTAHVRELAPHFYSGTEVQGH